jgi:hypothetical protein
MSELSNASLTLIAQYGQVELIGGPTVKPIAKPIVEPTIETNVDAHRYTIQADRNQFDNILIDTQSELIAIDSTTCQSIYDPSRLQLPPSQ